MDCSQQNTFPHFIFRQKYALPGLSSISHSYNLTTITYLSHACFTICTNPSNLFFWSPGSHVTMDFRHLTNSVFVNVLFIYATSLLICSKIVRSTRLHWCWAILLENGISHQSLKHQPVHQGLKGLDHTKAQSKSVHITCVEDWFHFGVKFAALPHRWDTRILITTLNQICTLYRSRCF